MSDEFSEELYAAIEIALEGSGVRPSWVMKNIAPIIEKYVTQEVDARVRKQESVCSAKYHAALAEKGDTCCGVCGAPIRR